MATYTITAPDGNSYDVTAPDTATQDEVLAYAKSNYQKAAPAAPPTAAQQIPTGGMAAPAAEPTAPPSIIQQMFGMGSPIARFAKGAVVDPALGVNQLLASSGLFGQDIKQGASQNVRAYEQATEQARAAQGSTGFDPFQLGGAVLSPVNKLVGGAQAVGTGLGSALARSAGTGATLAAVQPVLGPDERFTEQKLTQIGVGAALGPLVEGSIKAVGKLYSAAKGLTPAGRDTALRESLNKLVGPEREKAIQAMRDTKELVTGSRPTVAEVLSDMPTTVELAAAQKKLASSTGTGGFFVNRAAENQAARLRAIENIAQTPTARAALSAERGAVTGPMRESALDQSDLAGPIFTKLEKEIAGKFNGVAAAETTAGMKGMAGANQASIMQAGKPGWLTAGDLAASAKEGSGLYKGLAGNLRKEAQLKQFQLNSLEQNGFFPLKASDITERIDAAIRGARKDEVKGILQETRDKILSKADENGILNSRDLYENVRQSINRDITAYSAKIGKPFMGGLPEAEAKTAANIKKFVDSSLDKSSDGLWTKYIKSYTDYSNKLNRMEVGDYLSKKLNTPLDKEGAGAFAAAVENAAATIKSSTGLPRYKNLSDVLSKEEVSVVNNVLADLQRVDKAKNLASKISGVEGGAPNVLENTPQIFSQIVSVLKAGIRYLQQGNQTAYNQKMAELMLNPAATAQFMSSGLKKGQASNFVSALMKGMDAPTRAAFQQAFVIPAVSQEIGQ